MVFCGYFCRFAQSNDLMFLILSQSNAFVYDRFDMRQLFRRQLTQFFGKEKQIFIHPFACQKIVDADVQGGGQLCDIIGVHRPFARFSKGNELWGKGNLFLTLWIENTVLNTEYHFAMERTSEGGSMKDTTIRSPNLDYSFVKLADTAIRDYLENYDAVAADLRKKDPYIEREYQKYRGLPIVRLGSRLRREQKYLLFHQCVLSPCIRRQTLQEMNLPAS